LKLRPPYVSKLDLTAEFVDDCSDYRKPVMGLRDPRRFCGDAQEWPCLFGKRLQHGDYFGGELPD
jgi:hypothetical protein